MSLGGIFMKWIRSEEEVDKLLTEMLTKGRGNHITQSVVFNKSNPRQMRLLKMVLMSNESFSGFIKELITHEFSDTILPSEMEAGVSKVDKQSEIDIISNDVEEVENSVDDVKSVKKKGIEKFI